jgi:hypothetical protein
MVYINTMRKHFFNWVQSWCKLIDSVIEILTLGLYYSPLTLKFIMWRNNLKNPI